MSCDHLRKESGGWGGVEPPTYEEFSPMVPNTNRQGAAGYGRATKQNAHMKWAFATSLVS